MFLVESYILKGEKKRKKGNGYKTTQFQVGLKKYSKYSVSLLTMTRKAAQRRTQGDKSVSGLLRLTRIEA